MLQIGENMKIVDINVMIGPDTVSAQYNTASGLLS